MEQSDRATRAGAARLSAAREAAEAVPVERVRLKRNEFVMPFQQAEELIP